ncbi:MAG: class I SAM-dependent methyltransferase [Burkholderiaceae bacterium]|nr:class I SAM-dependent methyltransferase [Burkholderiaceae bacterium]
MNRANCASSTNWYLCDRSVSSNWIAARRAWHATCYPDCTLTGLEVDATQHAQNLAAPIQERLSFLLADAQNIPFADAQFDLVLMFKSVLHTAGRHGQNTGASAPRTVFDSLAVCVRTHIRRRAVFMPHSCHATARGLDSKI